MSRNPKPSRSHDDGSDPAPPSQWGPPSQWYREQKAFGRSISRQIEAERRANARAKDDRDRER